MLAVQGPSAREMLQAISDAPLPARFTVATRVIGGHTTLVCGTGYTGEDGVELLCSADAAGPIWDELLRRGVEPAGLAARDTLRLEVCYHLYGNDLMESRGPIEAGPGLVLQGGHGLHRLGRRARRARGGPGREARPVQDHRARASRARATRSSAAARSRAARCPRASASASAWPTSRRCAPCPARALQIDVRGKVRDAVVAERPLYSGSAA